MQTARPLATEVRALQPQVSLREQGFGIFEGKSVVELQQDMPELWQQWRRFEADFELPGGESTCRFHARIMQALTDLAELKLLQGNLSAATEAIQQALPLHGSRVYARTQRIFGRLLLGRGDEPAVGGALPQSRGLEPDRGALGEGAASHAAVRIGCGTAVVPVPVSAL